MNSFKSNIAMLGVVGVLTACAGVPMPSGTSPANNPVAHLQSGEWVVQSINGQAVTTQLAPTLNFGPTFQLTGHTSCNSYFAGYLLSGSSIILKQAGATRMACEPAVMQQEQRFLKQLSITQMWSIDSNAVLTLSGPTGTIVAKRR